MKKRLMCVSITIAALVMTAACGSSGNGTGDGASSGKTSTSDGLPHSAAEAGGMDALVAKAKKEGELSLYAGTTKDDTAEWVKGFEQKYGIKVKMYRDGSTTLYQKWAQETGGGVHNADVLIQNVFQLWQEAKSKGWITQYKTENLDQFDYDKLFPGSTDLKGLVYPLYQSVQAIAWNTKVLNAQQRKLVETDPVAAMADPSFKGLLALSDLGGATTIGNYATIILLNKDKYGWDWLEKVAKNDPAFFESQIPIVTQLAKGEYGITMITDNLMTDSINSGAPIEYAYPKPSNSALWMFGLPTKAPHPYAARLFMEWATTPAAQDRMTELSNGMGSRNGWTDNRTVVNKSWYSPPEELWYGAATDPQLQGDKLAGFVKKANAILGFD